MKFQQNGKVQPQRTLFWRRAVVGLAVLFVFSTGCSQSAPTMDVVESSEVSLPSTSKSQGQASSSVAQGSDLPKMPEFEGSIFSSLPIGQVATSELTAEIVELPRNKARRACFEAIIDLRISPRSLSVGSDACIMEMQECEKDSSSHHSVIENYSYDEGKCEVLSEYYDLEVAWKKLPSVCSNEANSMLEFTASNCFSKIEDMCNYRIDGAGSRMPHELFYRYIYEIRRGFCSLYLPVYSYRQISDNLSENDWRMLRILRYLNDPVYFDILTVLGISLPPNSVQTIRYMTNANLNSLLKTADICLNLERAPIDYECASALWSSCHNLRSVVSNGESPDLELSGAIAYLCSATYIAELAELAAVIFTSFKSDYEEGNFNEFRKFIAEEVSKREAYFSIDDTGVFVRADLSENLSDSTLAALQSLGESLGQLVLSVLPDEETTN